MSMNVLKPVDQSKTTCTMVDHVSMRAKAIQNIRLGTLSIWQSFDTNVMVNSNEASSANVNSCVSSTSALRKCHSKHCNLGVDEPKNYQHSTTSFGKYRLTRRPRRQPLSPSGSTSNLSHGLPLKPQASRNQCSSKCPLVRLLASPQPSNASSPMGQSRYRGLTPLKN